MGKKKRKTGMSKKILVGIGILVLLIALLAGIYFIYVYKPAIQEKEQLLQRFSEFETQYQEKKAQGYDVTEVDGFVRKARRAFGRKDYKAANEFLDNAFEALERAEKLPVIPEEIKEDAIERLSRVKVASLYQRVTDGTEERDIDDVITIFEETKTDFIFRGWWRWRPCPESRESAPDEVSELGYTSDLQTVLMTGYTYQDLGNAITSIKQKSPEVIFCGAIPGYAINVKEKNPVTGDFMDEEETWDMALDPEKWDIEMSKEELHEMLSERHEWYKTYAYFPDITNPAFQSIFLSWAEKQIDCGVDAIWIDGLYSQAILFNTLTANPDHPAVQDSYDAASKMVDGIHKYGNSKGKYIYVGTWATGILDLPYSAPDLDFITVTPTSEEISNRKLDDWKWDMKIRDIREKVGSVSIFAYMDFGTDKLPLAVFSQKLSPEEQRELLRYMDNFFLDKDALFIYPIHGGFLGSKATKLPFGRYNKYDSLAPEAGTYETIKELAADKTKS